MENIEKLKEIKNAIRKWPSCEKREQLFYSKKMMLPRERIECLLDKNTFFEIDMLVKHKCRDFGMEEKYIPADAVITGFGKVEGKQVAVYSQDFSALGGTYGEMTGKKICSLMDKAVEIGAPIIGICHSGGLRLQENLGPMEMFGQLFKRNSVYSGVVPQISIILGVVAGGQAYSPGLTDFILMTRDSAIFIAGPAFVKAQTGVEIDEKNLGGAEMHSEVSGLIDIFEESEKEIFKRTRELIKYLPSSYNSGSNKIESTDERNRCEEKLNHVVPKNSKKPFDMRIVINEIVDNKNFFEIKGKYAKNIIIGFARLDGKTVGIVANQPLYLGGVIDIKAAEKAARFVRFCDAFNLPILTFQDSPGYLIGESMERKGIIYKGAKLLYAYAEATVPLVTVIIRKAYAGAYIAMGSQYIGADLVYAWPNAEIGSVGEKTAASILFKKEGFKEKIENEYFEKYISAFHAASLRHINDIIEPKYTRPILIRSFQILENKSIVRPYRKHGNIPL